MPTSIYAEVADTLEAVQKLPPELSKKIYKEHITIKLRQRADLGWDKVNDAITKEPFCEHNEQIVKVLFCHKCRDCRRNGLCNMCRKNGVEHFLGYPVYYENDYDDVFKKKRSFLFTRVVAEPLRNIFLSFCLSHRLHDLICFMSDLIVPNGCRKFIYSIHKSMK